MQDIDRYLEDVDKGKQSGTFGEERKKFPSIPMPRPNAAPFQMEEKNDMPKPRSYAPAGMGNQVKGDIGQYRQEEAVKAFRKTLGGRAIRNPLSYRMPDTAIDPKYGPGDKVC